MQLCEALWDEDHFLKPLCLLDEEEQWSVKHCSEWQLLLVSWCTLAALWTAGLWAYGRPQAFVRQICVSECVAVMVMSCLLNTFSTYRRAAAAVIWR